MEVHAHAHTPRKKWTHYFWEFLMLFLAVFCGFMAENFRELQVEHHREKQYIRSFISDVELDIASLKLSSNARRKYINYYDSLVYLLKQNDKSTLNDIYFYARFLGRMDEFKYHDRTIQQLKSSGSLRSIRNEKAADSIVIYDNEIIKEILQQQEREDEARYDTYSTSLSKIFDGYIWNDMVNKTGTIIRYPGTPPPLTNDPKLISEFVIKVTYIKTSYRLTNNLIEKTIPIAENLITLLKKEYHLK